MGLNGRIICQVHPCHPINLAASRSALAFDDAEEHRLFLPSPAGSEGFKVSSEVGNNTAVAAQSESRRVGL